MAVPPKKNLKKVVDLRRKAPVLSASKERELIRKRKPKKANASSIPLKLTKPLGNVFARSAPMKRGVPQAPKKKMRLREKRAYRRRAIIYGAISVAVLGIVGMTLLTWNKSLAIHSVIITGNTTLSSKQLETATLRAFAARSGTFISGSTIITASLSSAENDLLNEFPKLKSAHLSRAGIDAVKLKVEEKVAALAWCGEVEDTAGLNCYGADKTGYIFEKLENMNGSTLPKVYGGLSTTEPLKKSVLSSHVGPLLTILDALKGISLPAESVIIAPDMIDARIRTESGLVFIVLTKDDATKTVQYLSALETSSEFTSRRDNIEYIDMRVGNRLFYKLKDSAVVPEAPVSTPVAQ